MKNKVKKTTKFINSLFLLVIFLYNIIGGVND